MGRKINHSINETRLWNATHDLAKIGATEKGGVRRLAYTIEDQAGRSYFIDCCRELGMFIERDVIGNIFATLPSKDGDLICGSIMMGSHLDTQANGGKYDGAYGVMCGLEIARSLHDHNIKLNVPFEIAVWANEEGARFAPPMMGSGAFIGHFSLEEMLDTKDLKGTSVRDSLENDQTIKDIPYRINREISAYFEPHIEQGPILENENIIAGIVTGAQAVLWMNIHIEGFQAHAGPTPMSYRRDSFLAAAEIALAAEEVALAHAPEARATIGNSLVKNPSRNVIPGTVELWLDIRHPNEKTLDHILEEIKKKCDMVAAQRDVSITFEQIWHLAATEFNLALTNSLRSAASSRNIETIDIISGAGHDALHMAMKFPTAMLFIPCKGGVSHNEAESIERDHAAKGCQILYDALLPLLTNDCGINAMEREGTHDDRK